MHVSDASVDVSEQTARDSAVVSAARARTHLPLTVVIAARDEAANIAACIESVRWADEILVAEQGSSDATVDVARTAGAVVLKTDATTIGLQRNAAIARAANEWILVVDADERGTPELRDEIARLLAAPSPSHDAYRVPRRNVFLRREIKHGGWERDRPVRLFRSSLQYNDSRVHEHVITTQAPGTLRSALWHYPYSSLRQYFDKFNRYSEWWAEQRFARGQRVSARDLWLRPPGRFFKMYFLQLGCLDGMHGLVLAGLASASVLAKYARLWGKWSE